MTGVTARVALFWGAIGVGFAVILAAAGCSVEQDPSDFVGDGGVEGDPCNARGTCAPGYLCAGTGTCQSGGAPGTQREGQSCAFNTDCLIDLACNPGGRCVKRGEGPAGTPCNGNEQCDKGLFCSSERACAPEGDPGAVGPGGSCDAGQDCALGLVCREGACAPVSFWAGVTCAEDAGPLRALFEIPRASKKVEEFYRLPFPNDIRLKNGKIDLSGHPSPGAAIPAQYGDVVGEYFKAIQEDVTGFGLNTAVLFRISRSYDVKALSTEHIAFVNIDGSSPGYGRGVSYSMTATSGRGKYICHNSIGVRARVGQPLRARTTYAVLLKRGLKAEDGAMVAQDSDFALVMGSAAPKDAEELAAWEAYRPLRDYFADKGLSADAFLSAAVFTTMDPRARMARFREVVHAEADTPRVADLTLCDGRQKSPCDDGSDPVRVCGATPSSQYHELQGTYSTPVFQRGTPPYKTPADGGAIAYDADGKPRIQRHDKACFALTVPRAPMPPGGWPVVIFAHGTGGSYRGFIENGTAERLAAIQDGSGAPVRMAVISIDGSMHGPRRGSGDSPDGLFFNLQNPRAARDNTYQGAADKYQLVRLLKSLALDTSSSPTGEAIRLDPGQIHFFGHSQGTIEGIPFAAYEPEIRGLVLSGAGGYLIGSFLQKRKPLDVAGLVRFALADGRVGGAHPLLNLLQLFFEEVDAVNYGAAVFRDPEPSVGGKHTFLSYGVADSFTPPVCINALSESMGVRQVRPVPSRCQDGVCNGTESCLTCADDCGKCPASATCGNGSCESGESCRNCQEDCKPCAAPYPLDDPPLSGNVAGRGGLKLTAAMVQYVSDGTYDDHFVVFKNADAIAQTTRFFGTSVKGKDGVPSIIKVQ